VGTCEKGWKPLRKAEKAKGKLTRKGKFIEQKGSNILGGGGGNQNWSQGATDFFFCFGVRAKTRE